MITPQEARSDDGLSESQFAKFLSAGIRANGIHDLCTEDSRWESGIETAISEAVKHGIKFDKHFILFDTMKYAHNAARYCLIEPNPLDPSRVMMSIPTRESALGYLKHCLPEDKVQAFINIAQAFLKSFDNPNTQHYTA